MQEVIGKYILEMDFDEEGAKITLSIEDGCSYKTLFTAFSDTKAEADKKYNEFRGYAERNQEGD